MKVHPTRRSVVAGIAGSAVAGFAARAQTIPPMPKSPVALNVIDVAGNLALTQEAIENYRKKNPKLVSRISYPKATSPELAGKLKAQQSAGRLDIDLVLTGIDGLAAGIDQKLWIALDPLMEKKAPGFAKKYNTGAAKMHALGEGQGITVVSCPGGPVFEYNPAKVKTVPQTAEDLLAWAKANPKRFMYARPANSGPGRTLLQGLPYILGDKDPKDPLKGWDKTWSYLKELDGAIEYYVGGTTPTMKELAEGSRDMIASMTGWDINPRALGVVPKEVEVFMVKNTRWITDAHYMAIPKGVADDKVAVLLDLMAYMLEPQQQAITYDKGYFYPGPAVANVPVSMAPAESQAVLKEFGRPQYEKWLAEFPHEISLPPTAMVAAFRRWDEQIGGAKQK